MSNFVKRKRRVVWIGVKFWEIFWLLESIKIESGYLDFGIVTLNPEYLGLKLFQEKCF